MLDLNFWLPLAHPVGSSGGTHTGYCGVFWHHDCCRVTRLDSDFPLGEGMFSGCGEVIIMKGMESVIYALLIGCQRHRIINSRFNDPAGDILMIVEIVFYPLLLASLSWIFVSFMSLFVSMNNMVTGWRGKGFSPVAGDGITGGVPVNPLTRKFKG